MEMKSKSKMRTIGVGTSVQWKWMNRFIIGSVKEVYTQSVSKTFKGKLIKRNGTDANPAYLVQSEAGNFALKLHTEIELVEQKKLNACRPKMFST